ncbi:hypothetical protein PHMEG_00012838 [Phytophthora megakarya]|uniref:DDE Tnp4 domain-containing protein n=1 Tax=Phytophthora megakarya TaxID=4795 RepID=A0A225W879_9STRA|nr:hypothetical protein PHMEG_00012838 [Phytophthora megakarya]
MTDALLFSPDGSPHILERIYPGQLTGEITVPPIKQTDRDNTRTHVHSGVQILEVLKSWLNCRFCLHYTSTTRKFSTDIVPVWSKHYCSGSWNNGDISVAFREALSNPRLNRDSRNNVVTDSAFPSKQDMRAALYPH